MELGNVRPGIWPAAPAERDRALLPRDRVVMATGAVERLSEIAVAPWEPKVAGVRLVDKLVEDRPRLVEVTVLQRLLEGHRNGIPQQRAWCLRGLPQFARLTWPGPTTPPV